MTSAQVVEVDDIKFRGQAVVVAVLEPRVVGNFSEVIVSKVIDEHRETLANVLDDDVPDDEVTFTGPSP